MWCGVFQISVNNHKPVFNILSDKPQKEETQSRLQSKSLKTSIGDISFVGTSAGILARCLG